MLCWRSLSLLLRGEEADTNNKINNSKANLVFKYGKKHQYSPNEVIKKELKNIYDNLVVKKIKVIGINK
jgi:hypothetical protein